MENENDCNVIDVKIFPQRYLNPETSEKILNEIYKMEGLIRVLVHGPSIPKKINYGPAKGMDNNNSDRKTINVNGVDVDLKLKVGEIIVTIDVSKLNEFMDELEPVLNEIMPCSYNIFIGAFTKVKSTISDYIKYGENFDSLIDERYIGLVDTRSLSSDTVKMINRG